MLESILMGNVIHACLILLQRFASGHTQRKLGHLGSWSEPGRVFYVSLCQTWGSTWSLRSFTLHQLHPFQLQFPVIPWAGDQYEYSTYSLENSFSKALKLSIIWFPTPAQEATTNSVSQETIHIPDYTYFGQWLSHIFYERAAYHFTSLTGALSFPEKPRQ